MKTYSRRTAYTISVLVFSFGLRVGAEDSVSFSDAHFHLLDFLQNGEFWNADQKFPGSELGLSESGRFATLPYGERGRRIEALLANMKSANVNHVMVCGMPFLKKWSENEPFMRPKYYLDSSSKMKRARDTDTTVASAIVD